MIIVVDADYREATGEGHVAGILCETPFDDREKEILSCVVDQIDAYQPGQFYRRELRCIDAVLQQTDIRRIELVIVDGYADFGTERKSLGTHVYEKYGLPVIGIAKNPFRSCALVHTEVLRGKSRKPLYVTSKGLELEKAREIVQNMAGEFRLPELVKLADQAARNWSL